MTSIFDVDVLTNQEMQRLPCADTCLGICRLDEVEGLEDLRAADLQNLRKYIEG